MRLFPLELLITVYIRHWFLHIYLVMGHFTAIPYSQFYCLFSWVCRYIVIFSTNLLLFLLSGSYISYTWNYYLFKQMKDSHHKKTLLVQWAHTSPDTLTSSLRNLVLFFSKTKLYHQISLTLPRSSHGPVIVYSEHTIQLLFR